ncbi:potassium transporter peripheral membrane component [beta proteobacterium AAP99]|nr:potassium transporter peripheral membrane component [beta proteobacterium AAP99]
MRVLIVGAGRVGESVAESLVSEANDITVIDPDAARIAILQDRLDLRGVVGLGTSIQTLREAGADDAELLVACATSDETNLVVSRIGRDVFNIPTRIVRVRSSEFQEHEALTRDGFAADVVICPEQSVTNTILKLVEFPEALQVLEFAEGRVSLVAVRAVEGGALVRQRIRELRDHLPGIDVRVVTIYRAQRAMIPDGETIIEPGDEVFVLAQTKHLRRLIRELRTIDKPVRRIMIAGGGNIGTRLAQALQSDYNLRVIDRNPRTTQRLATQLSSSALVLEGDATDEDLLTDESVQEMDLFMAVTNDDENNIMAALLAKRLGARRVIALINRKAYADMMQGSRIDIAIAPSQATIGDLLTHIRRGDVARVHSLRRGAAEALEAIAHGDRNSSKVVGRRIDQIDLFAAERGVTVGALVRGEGEDAEVIIAHHDTVIEAEDHVIVFVNNKRLVPKVEKLFQVSAGFF